MIIFTIISKFLSMAEYLTLVISTVLVVTTYLYYLNSRKTMLHQAFLDIQKDYRSPEMGYALHTLFNFYRDECNEDTKTLKKKYKKIFLEEEKKMKEIELKDRIEFSKNAFDYQRRLVTHFYAHLADLYRVKILSKEDIFDYWDWYKLRIIPNIIIPLDEGLNEILKSRERKVYKPEKIEEINAMTKLHNDSIEYYTKKREKAEMEYKLSP